MGQHGVELIRLMCLHLDLVFVLEVTVFEDHLDLLTHGVSDINHGFNVAEAVNFATLDWIPRGLECSKEYRTSQRAPVFSDDELIYHFITGTPTHGHSGRIVLMGREVRNVIHKRWERRIKKLGMPAGVAESETSSVDSSANN